MISIKIICIGKITLKEFTNRMKELDGFDDELDISDDEILKKAILSKHGSKKKK